MLTFLFLLHHFLHNADISLDQFGPDWSAYSAMQQLLSQGRTMPPSSVTPTPTSSQDMIALPRDHHKAHEQTAKATASQQAHISHLAALQGMPAYSLADVKKLNQSKNGHGLGVHGCQSPSPTPSPLHQHLSTTHHQQSKLSPAHSPHAAPLTTTCSSRTPSPNAAIVSETITSSRPPPIHIPTLATIGRSSSLLEGIESATPSTPLSPYTGQQGTHT